MKLLYMRRQRIVAAEMESSLWVRVYYDERYSSTLQRPLGLSNQMNDLRIEKEEFREELRGCDSPTLFKPSRSKHILVVCQPQMFTSNLIYLLLSLNTTVPHNLAPFG